MTIFVSVIVTVVSFYFFWGFFEPIIHFTNRSQLPDKLIPERFANVVFCSLLCGGVVYFTIKFIVEGFIGSEDVEIEKSDDL